MTIDPEKSAPRDIYRHMVAFITPHVVRREGSPAMDNSYKEWIENLRRDLNGGHAPTTVPSESAPSTPHQ